MDHPFLEKPPRGPLGPLNARALNHQLRGAVDQDVQLALLLDLKKITMTGDGRDSICKSKLNVDMYIYIYMYIYNNVIQYNI